MKKSIRILACLMVALILVVSLASCGKKLSGTYTAAAVDESILGDIGDALNSKTEIVFNGDTVTVEVTTFGKITSYVGEYAIEEGKITFTFTDDEMDYLNGTHTFAELENGSIEIGGTEYKKVTE